jgi:hypothetical protein
MQNVVIKKIYLKWDFAAGVVAQSSITPPPPIHTAVTRYVYVYTYK